MSEENEEYKEKFATIEEALKYIADSQARSEWLAAKNQIESRARLDQIEKHLAHITQLTGIAFEDLTFQDEKITSASEILVKTNPKRI